MQSLHKILGIEKGVLEKQGSAVRVSRKELEHAANGDPHPPDARLPAALPRFNRNSVKQIYHRHVFSLEHAEHAHYLLRAYRFLGTPRLLTGCPLGLLVNSCEINATVPSRDGNGAGLARNPE
jgi:hypothetical protein